MEKYGKKIKIYKCTMIFCLTLTLTLNPVYNYLMIVVPDELYSINAYMPTLNLILLVYYM